MMQKKKKDPVYSIGSQFITDFQKGYFQIQLEHLSNNPIRWYAGDPCGGLLQAPSHLILVTILQSRNFTPSPPRYQSCR